MTRFGEISPCWQYFNSLRRLCEGSFGVRGKILNLLWATFYAIGQIFIFAYGLVLLTNNLAIWSHWEGVTSLEIKTLVSETIQKKIFLLFLRSAKGSVYSFHPPRKSG